MKRKESAATENIEAPMEKEIQAEMHVTDKATKEPKVMKKPLESESSEEEEEEEEEETESAMAGPSQTEKAGERKKPVGNKKGKAGMPGSTQDSVVSVQRAAESKSTHDSEPLEKSKEGKILQKATTKLDKETELTCEPQPVGEMV